MPAALRCRLLALTLAACALALPQAARSEEMVDCIVMTSGGGVGQSAAAECASLLWPLPKGYKAGATTRAVDSAFAFDLHGAAASDTCCFYMPVRRGGGVGHISACRGGAATCAECDRAPRGHI